MVSHPGGGVKEQTAGTYAEKLAEKGFVTMLMTHLIKVKAAASRVS
ncbi:Dienelactone hydrolase and related enzymes [Escherichia coli ISC41]|nr:Dienelactone hydrolase and related enzymes [Escherichia coli ISC41]